MVLNEYVCRYLLMTKLYTTTDRKLKSKSVVTHGKAGLRYTLNERDWQKMDELNRMNS